jgi:hypothetical protein
VDLDALAGALLERVDEEAPQLVVGKDVALEEDALAGSGNGLEPRWIVLLRVAQQRHAIPQHQGGPRRAGQGLFRQPALHDPPSGLGACPQAEEPTDAHPQKLARLA